MGIGVALAASLFAVPSAYAGKTSSLEFKPKQVEAGQSITVIQYCYLGGAADEPVTSPGLAAPITVVLDPALELAAAAGYTGSGKVVAKAGTYTATAHCENTGATTATFTVTPKPVPPQGPPPATPKRQVPGVPSGGVQTGGVQTGGGGMAVDFSSR